MSRSEQKLNAVASIIRVCLSTRLVHDQIVVFSGDQYNREVRVIPVDFSDGQSVYADIQAEISDLDVAVLGEK